MRGTTLRPSGKHVWLSLTSHLIIRDEVAFMASPLQLWRMHTYTHFSTHTHAHTHTHIHERRERGVRSPQRSVFLFLNSLSSGRYLTFSKDDEENKVQSDLAGFSSCPNDCLWDESGWTNQQKFTELR